MITYSHKNRRHTFSMNDEDMVNLAEIIWLLKHSPPPMGFKRRPLTAPQQAVVDRFNDLITYPTDFETIINAKTGQ